MSWKQVRLGDYLTARENRYKPNDKEISDLKRIEKIDFSGKIYLSEKPTNTDMIIVKKGDLVISGINVEKGAMSVYQGIEDVIATIHYSSYEYNKNKIDIDFLKLFLKSPEFRKSLKEQVPGGIKTEIKPKHLLPLKIHIPTDIAEQRNIVDEFNKISDSNSTLDSELTHQLTLVKQLRQAFLSEAMQGKLVESGKLKVRKGTEETGQQLLERIRREKQELIKNGKLKKEKPLPPIKPEEIPFEIPKDWVWCRGEIVASYIDPQPSHRTPPESTEGVPYIAMSDIRKDGSLDFNSARKVSYTTLEEHQNRYKLQYGDFIFGKIGTIGKPVKLPSPFTYTLSANVILIQPERKIVNHDFLFYFLSSPAAEKNLIENRSMMSYPVFGMGKARSMPIPLPPLNEQNRIVQKLDELMRYCDELESSIKSSKEQNDMLLQEVLREAMEGKKYEMVREELGMAAEEEVEYT